MKANEVKNRRRFRKMRKRVGDGEQVCGFVTQSGHPSYFIMPADATDSEVRAEAYRQKYGREMSEVEKTMLRLHDQMEERGADVPSD